MTNKQVLARTRTATRRRTLGLLAALAVTLGSIAAPLATTAHASGPKGGASSNGSASAPLSDPHLDAAPPPEALSFDQIRRSAERSA